MSLLIELFNCDLKSPTDGTTNIFTMYSY